MLQTYTGGRYTPEVDQQDTFWPCTFNLSKVIMVRELNSLQQSANSSCSLMLCQHMTEELESAAACNTGRQPHGKLLETAAPITHQ
jgi:hypothetical protein